MLACEKYSFHIYTTINTIYTMTTEGQIALKDENMRVRGEKRERIKIVRRKLAAVENRDLSDTALLDEILEEGLTKREKKLGIWTHKQNK